MAVGAALRIAQQVVGALGAATFHGILHHAINPRNIMIVPGQTTDGEWPLIKVLNFVGIAPEVSAADAGALGAAYFASPEQLATGELISARDLLAREDAFLPAHRRRRCGQSEHRERERRSGRGEAVDHANDRDRSGKPPA
jgi:serine/threonine protein kinase